MATTIANDTPIATRNLTQAMTDLNTLGACAVLDALQPQLLGEIRIVLCRAAERDWRFGLVQSYCYVVGHNINPRCCPPWPRASPQAASRGIATRIMSRNLGIGRR